MKEFNGNYSGEDFYVTIAEDSFIVHYSCPEDKKTERVRSFSTVKKLTEFVMRRYGMLYDDEWIHIVDDHGRRI